MMASHNVTARKICIVYHHKLHKIDQKNSSGTNELIRPTTIRVTLGEHDLTKPEVPVSRELRIELIIPHPLHKCGKPRDDLALIRLAEDVTWSEVVAPACLPDGPSGKSYSDYAGTPATVAGWGWLNEDSSKGN